MKIIFPLLLLFVARSALSIVIVSSNGLQRAYLWSSRVIRWNSDQSIANYTIFNQTTGLPTALRENTFHHYDNTRGEITLTINDVQLWDAGNYSLQITQALTTTIDSTACLFVYGWLSGSLILSSGRNPAIEGDTLELTCNLTSTSMPAAYRPNIIYISWYIRGDWLREPFFNGLLKNRRGNIIPGYMSKNNGRTLVISSVDYLDQYICCSGGEHGGPIIEYTHFVKILYKPRITGFSPKSKKFYAAYGKRVELGIYWDAIPKQLSIRRCEFVNQNGVLQKLPPDSYFGPRDTSAEAYAWLEFNFTSNEYYGNYSCNLTNDIGITTVTFEVLPEDLNSNDHREDKNSFLIAVIALTLLLGIISLASLTAYLMRRFRTKREQLPTAHYQGIIKTPANEESPQSTQDNVYEELEDDDHSYARISSTRNEMDGYETVF